MGLNIKNERVHALAREAARITGKSQTSVIEEALELLLAQYGADAEQARIARTVEKVMRLAEEYRTESQRFGGVPMTVEDLYDEETGLPA